MASTAATRSPLGMRLCTLLATLLIPLAWFPGVGFVILILAIVASRAGSLGDHDPSPPWLRALAVDFIAGVIGALWTVYVVWISIGIY